MAAIATDRMTLDQVRHDRSARLKILRELGHNRIDITDTYLGRATAPATSKVAA